MVDRATNTEQHNLRRSQDRSREDLEIWVNRVSYALRHLDDRSKLNASPLARLAYVERIAKEEYEGHVLPRGLALRQLLLACVDRIVNEVGREPGLSKACRYLHLRVAGLSCRQISDEIGLSREHISRVYRRKALELLAEQFLYIVNGAG